MGGGLISYTRHLNGGERRYAQTHPGHAMHFQAFLEAGRVLQIDENQISHAYDDMLDWGKTNENDLCPSCSSGDRVMSNGSKDSALPSGKTFHVFPRTLAPSISREEHRMEYVLVFRTYASEGRIAFHQASLLRPLKVLLSCKKWSDTRVCSPSTPIVCLQSVCVPPQEGQSLHSRKHVLAQPSSRRELAFLLSATIQLLLPLTARLPLSQPPRLVILLVLPRHGGILMALHASFI